jgi:hypothetical protein
LKDPVENLQATPTSLPTTEPTTSQWSKTLAAADFPTITPTPYSVSHIACVYLAGKNTDTVSQAVYWRMIRNGTSVSSGSVGVSAGYFYTVNAFFYGVVAGDVIEVRLWATSANVNWDYDGFQVQPSRILTAEALNSPCYINFNSLATCPTLVKGAPNVYSTGSICVYHLDLFLTSITTPTIYDMLFPKATSSFYKLYYGDASNLNSALGVASSSYRPYYYRNYVPLGISLVVWKFW